MKLTAANEQAYKAHRQALLDQQTSLGQMMEKCGADADMKAGIQSLTDSINAQLAKLPPLDQVPAAMELAEQVNWFQNCWQNSMDYCSRIFTRLSEVNARLAGATAEVNGFNDKITKGELLTKIKHLELCGSEVATKVTDATAPLLAEISQRRKEFVEFNKWPMPEAELLTKPAPEFNAAVETLKKNLEAAKQFKMELNGKGHKALAANLWKPVAEFNAAIEQVADMADQTTTPRRKIALGTGKPETNEKPEDSVAPKNALFPGLA